MPEKRVADLEHAVRQLKPLQSKTLSQYIAELEAEVKELRRIYGEKLEKTKRKSNSKVTPIR